MANELFRARKGEIVNENGVDKDGRSRAHEFLAAHLKANPESTAECREDADFVYVFDGPAERTA